MAMTKCKECKADISTTADACPSCGAKQVRTSGCAKVVLWFIGIIVVLAAIGQCSSPSSTSQSSSTASSPRKVEERQTTPPPPPQPGAQWRYQQESDPMTSAVTRYAQVTSTNTVNFQRPYSGAQHATLLLREHPRHGKDVIMSIERGQILCRSYEDCNVLVRFDDQKPVTYSGVGPADNSTESVFIRNYSKFTANLKTAKRVRISTNIYQEGAPVFEFDVSDFDESKFKR
jgi:RNA polymerase subunit RPABC4/transcription elongation factor Spt4